MNTSRSFYTKFTKSFFVFLTLCALVFTPLAPALDTVPFFQTSFVHAATTPSVGYFGTKTKTQMKTAQLSGLWW